MFWVMDMKYVKRIRDLREDHDLTQVQVAEYLEMKQPQYLRYEKGHQDQLNLFALVLKHLLNLY